MDLSKNEDIKKVCSLLNSEDVLKRCDAVECLAEYIENLHILNIVIKMIDDKNYLVRCEVADALFNSTEELVLEKLIFRLRKEKKSVVRMHIVSTLCNIIRKNNYNYNYINSLKILFKKEKSRRVIIAYLILFYSISKNKKYLNIALLHLNNSDYHVRCNVISLVNDVLDIGNLDIIFKAYSNRLKIEKVFCVKDFIEKSIKLINNNL